MSYKDNAAENTDKEIWRKKEGDYYSSSIHVTKGGGIGINVGGYVFVKPVEEWHKLALNAEKAECQHRVKTVIKTGMAHLSRCDECKKETIEMFGSTFEKAERCPEPSQIRENVCPDVCTNTNCNNYSDKCVIRKESGKRFDTGKLSTSGEDK